MVVVKIIGVHEDGGGRLSGTYTRGRASGNNSRSSLYPAGPQSPQYASGAVALVGPFTASSILWHRKTCNGEETEKQNELFKRVYFQRVSA